MPDVATTSQAETALQRYLEILDGADGDPMELFTDDVEFTVCLPAATYSGCRRDLADYLASRDPAGRRRHHPVHVAVQDDGVLLRGDSRDGDRVLGTFMIAAAAGPDGRLRRFLATFAPALTFSNPDPRA
jgi:hypothetical protein